MNIDNEELNTATSEPQYTAEEKAFLAQLDAEEDAELAIEDKAESSAKEKADMLALKAALPFAAKGVTFIDGVLKAKDKRLAFAEEEKQQLTEAVAPVLVKYGAEPPEWLLEYGPELALLFTAGMIGFSKWGMVQEIRKEEAAERRAFLEAQKKAAANDGGHHAAAS